MSNDKVVMIAEERFRAERRKLVVLAKMLVDIYKNNGTMQEIRRMLLRMEYQTEEMTYAWRAMRALKEERKYGETIH